MKFTKGHIPLYFQFYLKLKQDIILGETPAGSRIPSIQELYETHEVSHGTIRKALELLQNEGLIVKKQRLGTFVKETLDLTMWSPGSSIEELDYRLAAYRFEPLSDDWVPAPQRVGAVFQGQDEIDRGGLIFQARYLSVGKADDNRRVLNTVYLPSWLVEALPGVNQPDWPIDLFKEMKRRRLTGVRQILRPWFCDYEAAELLKRQEGTPIFHRTWVPYIEGDQAVAYVEQLTTATSLERFFEVAGRSGLEDGE